MGPSRSHLSIEHRAIFHEVRRKEGSEGNKGKRGKERREGGEATEAAY